MGEDYRRRARRHAMKSTDISLLQLTFAAQKHKKAVEYMVRILRLFENRKHPYQAEPFSRFIF